MKFKIVPTIRVKFTKNFTRKELNQLINAAKKYDCQWKSSTISNKQLVETAVFISNQSKNLTRFKECEMAGVGKTKPVLTVAYQADYEEQMKYLRKVERLAPFFGGQMYHANLSENVDQAEYTLFFLCNWMCKAFAICMKGL